MMVTRLNVNTFFSFVVHVLALSLSLCALCVCVWRSIPPTTIYLLARSFFSLASQYKIFICNSIQQHWIQKESNKSNYKFYRSQCLSDSLFLHVWYVAHINVDLSTKILYSFFVSNFLPIHLNEWCEEGVRRGGERRISNDFCVWLKFKKRIELRQCAFEHSLSLSLFVQKQMSSKVI